LKTYYSVYAGYDIPTPPANVKYLIDSDNMGMLVSWDPANEVGEHGGYVDPDEVTYDFYTQSSAGAEILGTAGKQTSYHYTVNSNLQSRYYVGPVAVNSMGTSINGIFITETLGTPYKTPAKEDFGYTAFALSKWLYDTNAPFKGVTWEHCSEPDPAFATQIDFTNGGSFRATGTGLGQLIAPRISTKNDDRVKLKTRYWNYANAGKIEIWGKTYQNQEFRKVAEVEPSRPANGEWVEWGAVLPDDFGHQDWIQLNVRVNLAPGQNVILYTYEVAQNIDIDFQASSISTPYSAFIGENPSFNVVVTNAGSEPARGSVTVELLGDGEVLASRNADIDRIRPGENYEMPVSFYMDQSYINYDMLEIHAKASADGDENSRNDNCYASFLHYDNTLPIVRDLTATRSDNEQDVKLNWSEPKAISNGIESAENYCPFVNVEKIGEWTNVDIDGKEPFTISNKRWTGDSNPSSWVVFDAQEMATMSEDRLSPRSGNQMFMARSCAYVESEQPTRAMDFLISPEVKGGSKVGFWINTLSSTYSETVAIWYSTTDITLNAADVLLTERDVIPRECGSFKWLKNFTKSGSELWEYCEVTLPEDAKYFAFVYSSFGMFGAMIDDITYSPVNPVTLKPDTYNILASYANSNPVPVKFDVPSAGEYVLSNADGRETTYYVVGNYIDGDHTFSAPLSNPAKVTATGVDMIGADLYVRGGKGVIVIG
ncbi:MAG: hypothetical protein K2K29_00360, partial [Muribaculaceae bacterium]|nr:hypothetical protein [Muribaculaceae bacterium]